MLIVMKLKPLILISNDDGIESPGLHAAIEALSPIADLLIAAPASQQTAMGRSLRYEKSAVFRRHDLEINGTIFKGWSLEATPATTVRHALQCLIEEKKPDMVVSGVNFGENVGTDVTASGTVGAALQAAIWGYKALAVSLEVPQEFHYYHGEVDWTPAIIVLRRAAEKFLAAGWPEDVHVIKIDIPDNATEQTPWHVCRQSLESGWWSNVPNPHPAAPVDSSVGERGPLPGRIWKEGDDMAVIRGKKEVAITPLSVDLSSRVESEAVRRLFT